MSSNATVDELIKSLGNQLVGNESKKNFRKFIDMKINEENVPTYDEVYKSLVSTWEACNESVTSITNAVEDLSPDEIDDFILIEAKNIMEKAKNQENIYKKDVSKFKQVIEKHDIDKIKVVIMELRNTIQNNLISDFNEYQM